MKRATLAALGAGAVIGSAAAIGWGDTPAATPAFTIGEYQGALARIAARQGNALAHCDGVDASRREVCRTEASADAMVRVADVEERYRHDDRSAREAQRARIDAQYQVARARCQSFSGYRKDKCLISAHATRGRALLAAHAPYEMR